MKGNNMHSRNLMLDAFGQKDDRDQKLRQFPCRACVRIPKLFPEIFRSLLYLAKVPLRLSW
jgi:hypothetical protein